MKISLMLIFVFLSNLAFAKQTITCSEGENFKFSFNEKALNKVDETSLADFNANIFGKFESIEVKDGKVILENKNLVGAYVKLVFDTAYLGTQSDIVTVYYFVDGYDTYVFDCISSIQ